MVGLNKPALPAGVSSFRSFVGTRVVVPMSNCNNQDQPTVFVVDDDASVRSALAMLFRSVDMEVRLFATANEFLQASLPNAPCCLVLDVRLPGVGGIEFQAELHKAGHRIPIIFITGYGDVPMGVKAIKAGAVEFLTKPFRDQELLDAVRAALVQDAQRREVDKSQEQLRASFSSLTAREREVITLVASGMMNKQIAADLGVSEITVKVHRGNVMRKMGARSLAQLVRMSDALDLKRDK